MLIQIPVPPSFAIVDPVRRLPRFWATAWSLTLTVKTRAKNTLKLKLRHVDAFYAFCDERFGLNSFDEALSTRDPDRVAQMLEAFFLSVTDDPEYKSTAVKCWDSVRDFVGTLARQRATLDDGWSRLSSTLHAMGRIREPLRGRVHFIRAIPSETLEEMLANAHPESASNPFKGPDNKVRNWLAIHLMLVAGLRRGEVLLLSVNSLKRELDRRKGTMRYYLVVEENHDFDPRSATPSIKTASSFRRVPVTKSFADLWDAYIDNHRADNGEHGYLLTSRKGAPWAAESLSDMVRVLSKSLSQQSLTRFFDATGGKEDVSAHDFRHTCATFRYQQLIKEPGTGQELAMQKMRAFFGWAKDSKMPEHYARAAIEEDLLSRWSEHFELRLSALRGSA